MKLLSKTLKVLAATLASAQLASGDTLNPAFDATGRLSLAPASIGGTTVNFSTVADPPLAGQPHPPAHNQESSFQIPFRSYWVSPGKYKGGVAWRAVP